MLLEKGWFLASLSQEVPKGLATSHTVDLSQEVNPEMTPCASQGGQVSNPPED